MERGLMDPVPPVPDLGARLAEWLDVRLAIQLHPMLSPGEDTPALRQPGSQDLRPEVDETLGALSEAISLDRFAPGLWRIPMPVDVTWQPLVWEELWEPYRRYMADHQKQMALVLSRLRRRLRAALSDAGGACHALAQMDAIWDQTLTPREARLLASLPYKYEHRLAALMKSQDLAVLEDSPAVTPTVKKTMRRTPKPEGLRLFEQEIRQSLLTELQLRSQPVLGLIDALEPLRT
jgi:hypothetical protein